MTCKALLICLLFGLGNLYAQDSPTASGGDATGSGGTVNYSVGQIVFTINSGSNGSILQGVQQPYEISETLSINSIINHLKLSVFPNPTSGSLTLSITSPSNIKYLLTDIFGRALMEEQLTISSTSIDMESLSSATYFLTIFKNNQTVKVFKIIKK